MQCRVGQLPPGGLEQSSMKHLRHESVRLHETGFTLIELIIVMAVLAILIMVAVPSYRQYVMRVQRSEAINTLLQAAMCQERVYARSGHYDTGSCLIKSKQDRYELSYKPPNFQGQSYVAVARPLDAQKADHCGSLSLDQNGNRKIDALDASITQCWNGR